jgi:hypothetical protein
MHFSVSKAGADLCQVVPILNAAKTTITKNNSTSAISRGFFMVLLEYKLPIVFLTDISVRSQFQTPLEVGDLLDEL